MAGLLDSDGWCMCREETTSLFRMRDFRDNSPENGRAWCSTEQDLNRRRKVMGM
jgi:hypothetical protein